MIDTPRVSVVICSHNGWAGIRSTLSSLRAQTLADEHYEVIVVDDGSTDNTAAVAASAGARVFRVEPNGGLAAARNVGIVQARGQIAVANTASAAR